MLYFKTCSNTGPSIYWEMGNTMKHSALQKFNYVLLCLLIAGFLTVLIGVVESGGRFFYSEGEARIDGELKARMLKAVNFYGKMAAVRCS